ncbi:retrotransposon protein, putative, ty1-copia subclass, partial [Tanacetum coccineum]
SYASGPGSDKETQIKSTKREHVKIVKGLTSRQNSPYVGKGPWSDKETQTKCTCSMVGWHRLKIRHKYIALDIEKNHSLEDMVNAMFVSLGLSHDMWGKAIISATYLLDILVKKEIGRSSRINDEVVQDQIQRDDNDLQDERQDQTEEEEVEPRRSKGQETRNHLDPVLEAIKSEIDSILQNHTWELVDLPPGCKPLDYKWIFKKKMKADDTIDKYKARLVIKGYRQRKGLDYFDTYSPVTRITSIRMILDIAALRNLEVYQMDVKTAFLNGDLEEEIYMNQPEGFIAPG